MKKAMKKGRSGCVGLFRVRHEANRLTDSCKKGEENFKNTTPPVIPRLS